MVVVAVTCNGLLTAAKVEELDAASHPIPTATAIKNRNFPTHPFRKKKG
jgi:hypothetical protein